MKQENKEDAELTAYVIEIISKRIKKKKPYTKKDVKKFVDDFYKRYGKMMSKLANE